jgi:hypothetical protein
VFENVNFFLNWKSLAQPAILPINTDYIPTVLELKENYEEQTLSQLLVDNSVFLSPECLLKELVCQRLTMVIFFH